MGGICITGINDSTAIYVIYMILQDQILCILIDSFD